MQKISIIRLVIACKTEPDRSLSFQGVGRLQIFNNFRPDAADAFTGAAQAFSSALAAIPKAYNRTHDANRLTCHKAFDCVPNAVWRMLPSPALNTRSRTRSRPTTRLTPNSAHQAGKRTKPPTVPSSFQTIPRPYCPFRQRNCREIQRSGCTASRAGCP